MRSAEIRRLLKPVVEREMKRLPVPGVAVGIHHDGADHGFGFGVTNLEFPLPVDPDTLFLIGSTTKTFTGTVMMKLVDEGRLDLDAPVTAYLPKFRVRDETVTREVRVRHLVTHTAGWFGDYFDDTGRGDDALRRIVTRMARQGQQVTPLGSTWSYNNASFYVAGRVIEAITGDPYEQVVAKTLLEPLGMDSTTFLPEVAITRKAALGHIATKHGGLKIARPWGLPRSANAAGGLASNVPDQLRWARFHLGDGTASDGTRVLERATVKRMQEPLAPAGGMADNVGVTWLLENYGRTRVVKHGGSINGQMSAFAIVPSRRFAITVLTNAWRGGELGNVVVAWALERLAGVEKPHRPVRSLSERRLAGYTGDYPMGEQGHVRIRLVDGALEAVFEFAPKLLEADPDLAGHVPPPVHLCFTGTDLAVTVGEFAPGRRVDFLRGDDNEVAFIRWGGRLFPRQPFLITER